MKKNHFIILLVVLPMLALIAGIAAQRTTHKFEKMTSFSLPDLAGKQHSSSEWQGKILIINFWATWCPSCREEIPEFIKLQNQYQAKDVQFIGIAIDKPETVASYLESIKINYPILIAADTGLDLARQMGNSVDALPYTVIVNKQGQQIYQGVGEFPKEELEQLFVHK